MQSTNTRRLLRVERAGSLLGPPAMLAAQELWHPAAVTMCAI